MHYYDNNVQKIGKKIECYDDLFQDFHNKNQKKTSLNNGHERWSVHPYIEDIRALARGTDDGVVSTLIGAPSLITEKGYGIWGFLGSVHVLRKLVLQFYIQRLLVDGNCTRNK